MAIKNVSIVNISKLWYNFYNPHLWSSLCKRQKVLTNFIENIFDYIKIDLTQMQGNQIQEV